MAQVLGIVDIVWRGRNLSVEKGAKFIKGGIINRGVVYGRKVGRAQEFVGSRVEAVVNLERGKSLRAMLNEVEGELQVVCDTRQTFVVGDAFLSGDMPEVTGGEGGKITLIWEGSEAEEIL